MIPSIKEDRIGVILRIIDCVERFKFKRADMKDCILSIYPNKSEKSVFRGVAIPTLRNLGLLFGYGDYIRLSSNASLIVKCSSIKELKKIVVMTIFHEIDKRKFGFIQLMKQHGSNEIPFIEFEKSSIGKSEYKKRWLKILKDCELVFLVGNKWKDKVISLCSENISMSEKNLNYQTKKEYFSTYLFVIYEQVTMDSAGIIDIEELRRRISSKLLEEKGVILTEDQFDNLLRETPLVTNEYIISLGQPMGADEKLFEKDGTYYKTISIKRFIEGEDKNV